jgi:putative protein kinase ArgK-like GTPase of G3E family
VFLLASLSNESHVSSFFNTQPNTYKIHHFQQMKANFSPELADFTIYVIDVSGGDKVPRKGGPGVTQSDVLVVNKTDLAPAVGASLEVMERDSKRMRGDGPTVFAQARENLGLGVDKIVEHVLMAWSRATQSIIPDHHSHDHGHSH